MMNNLLKVVALTLTSILMWGCTSTTLPSIKTGDRCLVRLVDYVGVYTVDIKNAQTDGWIEMKFNQSEHTDRVGSPTTSKPVWMNTDRIVWIAPNN
jgi:hypothetical protein